MRFSCCKVVSSFLFFTFTFFLSPVFAWNATAHMLVANIAYEQLKPKARMQVDRFVSYLHQEYEDVQTFAEAAVWADRLRWQQQLDVYTHWHYIDQPLVRDGGKLNTNIIDSDNALWAIDKIRSFVANEKANPYERARFLALLIHIVGDIHQPLHTVALVTPKFPEGDRGGNDYFVTYKNRKTNLHKIWDEGVGAFEQNYYFATREDKNNRQLTRHTNLLTSRYPTAYFAERLKQAEVKQWLKEGMDLANSTVYTTPENQAVSNAYVQKASMTAEQQVTLAGYRLAQLLNQLFV